MKPIQFEEFEEVIQWWHNRTETENAWKIDFATLLKETDAKAEVLASFICKLPFLKINRIKI